MPPAVSAGGLVIGFVRAWRAALRARASAAGRARAVRSPTPSCGSRADDTITVHARAFGDGPGHLDRAADAHRRGARVRLVDDPRRARTGRAGLRAHPVRHADDRRSSTVYSEFTRYRQVGATARADAGGRRGRPPRGRSRAVRGRRTAWSRPATSRCATASSRRPRHRCPPPAEVPLKPRAQWKLIGKPTRRLDSPGQGRRQRAVRHRRALRRDCKVAVVARSPVFGGKLKGFKADAARAVTGVRAVVEVPSGVAVVADHYWAARAGRDALEVEWDLGALATLDSATLQAGLRRPVEDPRPGGGDRRRRGGEARRGRRGDRGAVRRALPRARGDGAAQLHGADRRGQVRDLDRHPVPDLRPASPRRARRHRARPGRGAHDLSRRRLRPARQSGHRLRRRGRARGQGRRPAGQDGLVARGRYPRWLLPPGLRASAARGAWRRRRHRGIRRTRWSASRSSPARRSSR